MPPPHRPAGPTPASRRRFDGRVYEALFDSAQPHMNPMNAQEVDPAFKESLLPLRATAARAARSRL